MVGGKAKRLLVFFWNRCEPYMAGNRQYSRFWDRGTLAHYQLDLDQVLEQPAVTSYEFRMVFEKVGQVTGGKTSGQRRAEVQERRSPDEELEPSF